jgi:hypothetical protein
MLWHHSQLLCPIRRLHITKFVSLWRGNLLICRDMMSPVWYLKGCFISERQGFLLRIMLQQILGKTNYCWPVFSFIRVSTYEDIVVWCRGQRQFAMSSGLSRSFVNNGHTYHADSVTKFYPRCAYIGCLWNFCPSLLWTLLYLLSLIALLAGDQQVIDFLMCILEWQLPWMDLQDHWDWDISGSQDLGTEIGTFQVTSMSCKNRGMIWCRQSNQPMSKTRRKSVSSSSKLHFPIYPKRRRRNYIIPATSGWLNDL